MAAPSFVKASTGSTDSAGAWTHTGPIPAAVGNVLIVHILQDGTNAGAPPVIDSVTNAANLAGTGGSLTVVAGEFVGSPSAAIQRIQIGRATATSAMVITGSNAGGDDVYVRVYEFQDVSTGTTLATVIENGTAGTAVNGTGTGTTLSDTGVTTLGPDRLALQLIAANDDINLGLDFVGESGGLWVHDVSYAESSGTDGAISLHEGQMASAGTIDGGTFTIVSAAWGVIGFALIGTTAAPPSLVLSQPALDFGSTAVL